MCEKEAPGVMLSRGYVTGHFYVATITQSGKPVEHVGKAIAEETHAPSTCVILRLSNGEWLQCEEAEPRPATFQQIVGWFEKRYEHRRTVAHELKNEWPE
jgi:hypothetical protein